MSNCGIRISGELGILFFCTLLNSLWFLHGVLQGQEQCLSRVHFLAPTSFSIIEVDVVFEYLAET